MMIPILPALENRKQWIEFFQRERSYAQVRTPNCRIDLQTTYLQLTRFDQQKAIRYTLGSRTTLEPVWEIISRCNWSLKELVAGLDSLEPGSTVRDKGFSDWSPDLTVRRSIPREQQLYSEAALGAWPEPTDVMAIDSLEAVCSLVAWRRIEEWESILAPLHWLLEAQDMPEGWEVRYSRDGTVQVEHPDRPSASFKVRL